MRRWDLEIQDKLIGHGLTRGDDEISSLKDGLCLPSFFVLFDR